MTQAPTRAGYGGWRMEMAFGDKTIHDPRHGVEPEPAARELGRRLPSFCRNSAALKSRHL
ncbi:MAG: hypothetical protein A3H96_20850 [Acidobacteria bacterium RIFCSPLOWO2_02_FULL_67_36]|nr:MAG: hypothetical protein A3H96_20850 [Acidobacteria bacterium RIFCSPLOWO2_02_FULL_67_36]OFW25455.1 MAG: hypothetical protein A3G21_19405 [Acidobacteria bacterium RIFCSPLOWO2_12_FULL_66_21]